MLPLGRPLIHLPQPAVVTSSTHGSHLDHDYKTWCAAPFGGLDRLYEPVGAAVATSTYAHRRCRSAHGKPRFE